MIKGKIYADLSGQTFGRLTVTSFAGRTSHREALWNCVCACGRTVETRGTRLVRGNVSSCGCLRDEQLLTHGKSYSSEYRAFAHAKERCQNPNNNSYDYYGGRGIEFRFSSFESFLEHIGPKPSFRLQLDRIDNDGHYEPGNVRWATKSQQMKNRRSWSRAKKEVSNSSVVFA